MYLFDTTYILPSFRIKVNINNLSEDMQRILLNKSISRLLCSVSLIEAKWKCIGEYRKQKDNRFLKEANISLKSYYNEEYFQIINPWKSNEILSIADQILEYGHNDYMDCLILATAKYYNCVLISEDKQFSVINKNLNLNLKLENWNSIITKIND